MKTISDCFNLANSKSSIPSCDLNQIIFILQGGKYLSSIELTNSELRLIVDELLFNTVYSLKDQDMCKSIIYTLINSVQSTVRVRQIFNKYSESTQYYSDRYFANRFVHSRAEVDDKLMFDLTYWLYRMNSPYTAELHHSVKNILRRFYYHAAVIPAISNPADEFRCDRLEFKATFKTIINKLYAMREIDEDTIALQLSTCVVVFLIILNLRYNTLYTPKYACDNKVNSYYRSLLVQIIWS